ncbi:hypothetical protein [Pseudomonas sp. I2]|uniref:hypothetical protein n=1 Tax=Pseudomonas sp. I2 TaxID=1338438 RepID=UPI0034D3A3C7
MAKRLPGGNVVDAGAEALDVALNAETQDEKAEGYGGAAGSLAGTLAGAAAGAAIGSVVPVLGTAVGGALGAVLGGMGGESLGGWLGKKLFGEAEPAGPARDREAPASPAIGDAMRTNVLPGAEASSKPPMSDPSNALGDASRTTKAVVPTVVSPVVGDVVRPKPESPAEAAKPVRSDPPGASMGETRTALPVVPRVVPPVVGDTVRAKPEPAPLAPGDLVRDLVKAVPPAPPVLEVAKPAPAAKAPPPKVEQSFQLSLSIPVVVQGDMKDPARFASDLEPHIRRQVEAILRDVASRQSAVQLFDAPHV